MKEKNREIEIIKALAIISEKPKPAPLESIMEVMTTWTVFVSPVKYMLGAK